MSFTLVPFLIGWVFLLCYQESTPMNVSVRDVGLTPLHPCQTQAHVKLEKKNETGMNGAAKF